MARYRVRLRVEYTANATVEADSMEEARQKVKAGEWENEQLDGLVDWGDQNGNPDSIEEDE